jgi:DNA-binding transcriptional LysR family regulator
VTRHLTGYRLTALGEALRLSAERVEAAVAAFERGSLDHGTDLTNAVRVTTTGYVADRLRNSPLVDAFHARHPDLRLELVVSDRCLDLAKGEADLAIRAGEPKDESLVGRKIADVPWAVYAARSYIERHGAPRCAEDMERHFVVSCDDRTSECPGTKWLRSVAPHARVAASCDTAYEQMRLVKSGAGLAPLLACHRDDEFVRVIDNIGVATPFYLLMHKDLQRTPRVRAFADFAASEIKALRALIAG